MILVTSVGENEGKSTIAANLALALAAKNRRVVLLDCDFRKPSLHKIFDMPAGKEKTLTSYLLQEKTDPSSCLIENKKHGIFLSVSQNSGRSVTKLLNNGRLPALLQGLRTQMDYIILDTPPMLAAADAETLARLSDTALLVVRSDFMPASAINQGLRETGTLHGGLGVERKAQYLFNKRHIDESHATRLKSLWDFRSQSD